MDLPESMETAKMQSQLIPLGPIASELAATGNNTAWPNRASTIAKTTGRDFHDEAIKENNILIRCKLYRVVLL